MTDARAALILYAAADEPFVRGFLLPAIGGKVTARAPLQMSAAELDEALRGHDVIVPVISAAFLADPWTRASEAMATDATKDRPELAVVPLVLEDVALPTHIAYRMTLGFQDRGDWDRQAERLRGFLVQPAAVEPELACPYPGMRPFQAADARYFCGRATELSEIRTMLAAGDREIYLVGPSGSGKSSLIGAGLVPQLEAPVTVATMRPGADPMRALADCLGGATAAAWAAAHPEGRLVLFVDQLEELFAQAPKPAHAAFAAALAAFRAEPRCVILLALRADFYGELQLSPLWTDAGRRHVDLPPLRGDALREAIVEPARQQGVYLETALVERLLADAAGEPGVLPLLQETLVQLWGHRQHCLLTLAAYDALGDAGHSGLAVAVSSRADRCLAELTPAQAAVARLVLLRLVSFGEGRPNTRRRQTRGELATGIAPATFAIVLPRLIDARLITVGADDQVDLCHEILIAAWPSFAAWIESRRADEQRRRHIQASADAWITRGRGASGLLDAPELATAMLWRTTDAAKELGESAEVTQLIDRSRRALTRARWLRRLAVVAILAIAIIIGRLIQMSSAASGEADRQTKLADTARGKATRALGEQYRELGRQALVDGNPLRAIPYLVAAREHGIDDPALRMMFHAARPTAIERTWPGASSVVAYRDDGQELAIADQHGVQRYAAATGAPIGPRLAHADYANLMSYSPGGAQLVTMIVGSKVAWLWDLSRATPRALAHDAAVTFVQFSPDGSRVVTAGADRTARIWDARTGAEQRRFAFGDKLIYAELNADNSRLAATSSGGSQVLWNAETRKPIDAANRALTRELSSVRTARFSARGDMLVTASFDGLVERWQTTDGRATRDPIKVHASDAMFSPDGRQLLTVGDQDVQLWGDDNRVLASHTFLAQITFARFSGDGSQVLIISDDRTLRLWTPATDRIDTVDLEASPHDAVLSPDATRLLVAGTDATRLWQLSKTASSHIATDYLYDVAFSPDGKWLTTSNTFGKFTLRTAGGAPIREFDASMPLGRPMFSTASDRFAISDENGLVRLIVPPVMYAVPHEGRGAPQGNGFEENLFGHPPPPAALSADGHRIAMLGDHAARIWDADTGAPITPPMPHAAAVRAIRFSPDGARVATAAQDGAVQLWDARTGARLGDAMPHGFAVHALELSPDGRSLVAISATTATLWDLTAAPRRRFVVQHGDRVIEAKFSPDGARLLTYSFDHTAKLVDVATGLPVVPDLRQDNGFQLAAFSPDGTRIMTLSPLSIQIWDAATGRPLGLPLVHPQRLYGAAFSPDGNTLATAAADGARLWDIGLDNRSLADWQRAVPAGEANVLLDPVSGTRTN